MKEQQDHLESVFPCVYHENIDADHSKRMRGCEYCYVESAHALGAREYFDDADTWAPPGEWFDSTIQHLRVFNRECRHQHARIALGCNDRPGARRIDHYLAMAQAGFRFILFGLESANFDTFQRINKGQHLVGHALADYVLQPEWMAKHKNPYAIENPNLGPWCWLIFRR